MAGVTITDALREVAAFIEDIDTDPDGYPWRDDQSIIKGIKIGSLRAIAALAATPAETTGSEAVRRERKVIEEIALSVVDKRIADLEYLVAYWKERAEERLGWYHKALARLPEPASQKEEKSAS